MKEIRNILDGLKQEEAILVFLGGVHGVGKTTLCNEAFKPIDFYCVTASSLIKKYGLSIQKTKRVKNIENNQIALYRAIKHRAK